MRRTQCGSCASTALADVLDLGDSALADEFPTTAEAAMSQQRYPLGLTRCTDCTMVQLTDVVPDEALWAGEYGFYTGASWVAVKHQHAYADAIMRDYPRLCRQGVLEIACNDGSMLERFATAGHPTIGIDPARGPALQAIEKQLPEIWIEQFNLAAAARILDTYGPQGVVIANNVIAHVADLDDFIAGLALVLAPHGVAVVEFQYLPDLLVGNSFDLVYHEHRQFLSLTALKTALTRHELLPQKVTQNKAQGGSLRVVIAQQPHHADHSVNQVLHDERWLNDEHALSGLQGRADRIQMRLRDMLWRQKQDGARVAGYGASAKSTTLLNWCRIGPDLIQYIVDATPIKHGRFTPGTGIPIVSPSSDSRAPDVYVMFVHNYLTEVMRQETVFASLGGRWLIPVPAPVLI